MPSTREEGDVVPCRRATRTAIALFGVYADSQVYIATLLRPLGVDPG